MYGSFGKDSKFLTLLDYQSLLLFEIPPLQGAASDFGLIRGNFYRCPKVLGLHALRVVISRTPHSPWIELWSIARDSGPCRTSSSVILASLLRVSFACPDELSGGSTLTSTPSWVVMEILCIRILCLDTPLIDQAMPSG